MKHLIFIPIMLLTFISCDNQKSDNSNINLDNTDINNLELKELKKSIDKKDKTIDSLKNIINDRNGFNDYYRFIPSSDDLLNVYEKLNSGDKIVIDKKGLLDTLDISDNFFVYKHDAKIFQTKNQLLEGYLFSFGEVLTGLGDDYFVKVITMFNGESLPLETENSKTDIHILIQPTELGYENRTFVISDFYDVKLNKLYKQKDDLILSFDHGKFPRKNEKIIIKPELVKFID
jgi:hypothetical protein